MIPNTVSLFCGAGGESLGKHLAFEELGIPTRDLCGHAINHWDLAVATHGINFPWINVHQEDITQVSAATYGLERIHLLWASPSCVHHSRARGGKPKEEQQRSHAWEVVDRWLRVAQVDVLMVENVPEFQDWGPLDDEGQPIKDRKGEDFLAFVSDLKGLGYTVERFVLNGEGRRYAYPTVEAAKASFLIRKRRHIEHLETAMIFARAALKGIQAPEFVPGKPFHDETLDPFHCY